MDAVGRRARQPTITVGRRARPRSALRHRGLRHPRQVPCHRAATPPCNRHGHGSNSPRRSRTRCWIVSLGVQRRAAERIAGRHDFHGPWSCFRRRSTSRCWDRTTRPTAVCRRGWCHRLPRARCHRAAGWRCGRRAPRASFPWLSRTRCSDRTTRLRRVGRCRRHCGSRPPRAPCHRQGAWPRRRRGRRSSSRWPSRPAPGSGSEPRMGRAWTTRLAWAMPTGARPVMSGPCPRRRP